MNDRPIRPKLHNASLEEIRTLVRPEDWESDISRNALDDRPFENQPPPCECEAEILAAAPRHLEAGALDPLQLELLDVVRRDRWPIPIPEDREGYC
ncbi:MAG TPA: hypothetical protein PKA37_07760, partial [Planctomycetota bacterium]|nr:hypothetical protein [Planctomycetota bacterium]